MSEPKADGTRNQQIGRLTTALVAMLARPRLICLLLALITLVTFMPVKDCKFVYCDDPKYVTDNPHVQSGLTFNGIVWAFTATYASNWHPLTWLSHMLDVNLFGKGPAGPHVINLLFHIANTVLLFLVLRSLTAAHWPSAFVAALFALHPLHVESVAWVTERKDVLSTLFWLLTLWFYGRYAQAAPEAESQESETVIAVRTFGPRHRTRHYFLALLFFLLGLMSKPMLVTLPFVLLLLDYWPLGRMAACRIPVSNPRTPIVKLPTVLAMVREKIPFFVLSVMSCVITLWSQARAGSVSTLANLPFSVRTENTFVSYARYLGEIFWPVKLAVFYPYPEPWPVMHVVAAATLVIGLCVAALWVGRKFPFVITGWFWFLGSLVPVIGLVQVGAQAIADRYMYVPSIGIFIALTWSANAVLARWRLRQTILTVTGTVILIACALRTADQLRYWQNSEVLARRAIAVTKNNWMAYHILGYYLDSKGRSEEAVQSWEQVLRINPDERDANLALGLYCCRQGDLNRAVSFYQRGLQINSHDADLALGVACYKLGDLNNAAVFYQRALQIDPTDATTLNGLGSVLADQKQFAPAIEYYRNALRLNPNYVSAYVNLGTALSEIGRNDEALEQYREALKLAPDNPEIHNGLGGILFLQGRSNEAIQECQQALAINPDYVYALRNLGSILAAQGRYDEAIPCLERALRVEPANAGLHVNLAYILDRAGRRDDAMLHLREALRLNPDDPDARQLLETLEVPAK
jgi:tetratricopeptide (TPR) repeat protein